MNEIIMMLLIIMFSSIAVTTLTIILFTKMWNDYFMLNRKYNVLKKGSDKNV